jgi:hypothetical protein
VAHCSGTIRETINKQTPNKHYTAVAAIAYQLLPHTVIQRFTAAALYGKKATSKHATSTVQQQQQRLRTSFCRTLASSGSLIEQQTTLQR